MAAELGIFVVMVRKCRWRFAESEVAGLGDALSRVRLIGRINAQARSDAGYRWFNSLPAGHAIEVLTGTGISPGLAAEIEHTRPLANDWLMQMNKRAATQDAAASYRAVAEMIEGQRRPAVGI